MLDATQLAVVNDKFPRIAKNISFLWGNKELNDYMNKLVNDIRDGKRQGFPFEVFMALTALSMQHKSEFPFLVPFKRDPWDTD